MIFLKLNLLQYNIKFKVGRLSCTNPQSSKDILVQKISISFLFFIFFIHHLKVDCRIQGKGTVISIIKQACLRLDSLIDWLFCWHINHYLGWGALMPKWLVCLRLPHLISTLTPTTAEANLIQSPSSGRSLVSWYGTWPNESINRKN